MGIHESESDAPRPLLVVTTDYLPGYEVRHVLGQVMGITVRTQNPFSEGVKALDGGVNPRRVQAITRWREDALNRMIDKAKERGANAIIGMRFDHRVITEHWAEICAYGTAVIIAPARSSEPPAGAAAAGQSGAHQR